jgi:asparagine synthase (glutamine-hydrolysing)
MFAFAFYDRAENNLLLARDRLGIKPLYYLESKGNLYWASEIKAIAQVLDLAPDPIRTFCAVNNMGEKSTEHTLFKGLRSVRPGTYLSVNGSGEPKSTTYYDVVEDFDNDLHRSLSKQNGGSVVAHFEELFTDSVKQMLVSDAPVGAFVSGGIDSSLVSAVATNCSADLKLFTANVLGKYSEFDDVKVLAAHLQREIFEYRFEPQMMLRDWAHTTYHYDCPIVIHVNAIPFAGVAQLARDSGVKAVLTGEGADELFLGYPALLARRYEKLVRFPFDVLKSAYKLSPKMYAFLFPERSPLPSFTHDLVQGFEIPRLKDRADRVFNGLGKRERQEQYLCIRMLREHLVTLLHRNDRMGMMASIEARFPFLDEAIVKFAISLPAKYKIGISSRFHNYKHPFLTDKWVVRKLAEKYLPKKLVTKQKNGFPMFGHKFLKVRKGFFSNGWVADSLGLSESDLDYMLETQEPYFVAKLASVELFGRLFALKTKPDDLRQHVLANAEIVT